MLCTRVHLACEFSFKESKPVFIASTQSRADNEDLRGVCGPASGCHDHTGPSGGRIVTAICCVVIIACSSAHLCGHSITSQLLCTAEQMWSKCGSFHAPSSNCAGRTRAEKAETEQDVEPPWEPQRTEQPEFSDGCDVRVTVAVRVGTMRVEWQ